MFVEKCYAIRPSSVRNGIFIKSIINMSFLWNSDVILRSILTNMASQTGLFEYFHY